MTRISSTSVSVSDLNSVYGRGYAIGSYNRSSSSVKDSTIALAPAGSAVSLGRLRGSFPSGTYRNINMTAGSTTSGINVFPGNNNQAYYAGLSNNADPLNSYTTLVAQWPGNRGYGTTSNVYRQYYYVSPDASQPNTMYWRISNKAVPFAGGFEEQGAWVCAIGVNYWNAYLNSYFDVSMYDFFGGGNQYNAYFAPGFYELFDGNNFLACYVYSGTMYFGMVNRAQLRAGVIQPVYAIGMFGPGGIYWDNSMMNISPRIRTYSATGGWDNSDLYIGWDEYILRGYDLPPEARLYGAGDTDTRNTVLYSGSNNYIDGRIFE